MPPVNNYFNNFPGNITSEQLLIEDLAIESIKQYGMDVYYIPRESRDQIDYLYGEEAVKKFTSAYVIEMYLENVMGMDGQGDILSKFGLEVQDEVSLLVSRRRFKFTIPSSITHKPREGDLVYVPLFQNFFEITFVEHEDQQAMFYTLGRGRGANVYLFALKLKQFVFSEEKIQTGIEEIDEQIFESYRRTTLYLANGSGNYVSTEDVFQGNSSGRVHSWDSTSNTLIVIQTIGDFSNSSGIVTGNTSGATWNISTNDPTISYNSAFEDIIDNRRIQTEASDIIDFSESNPFGSP